MAKKKTKVAKKATVHRKVKPVAFVPIPIPMPVEVVLVPVPVEKTKTSDWHKWVDWIWK